MIDRVLPAAVRTRVVYGDALDNAPLHREEADAVSSALPKRRAEFTAGRACSRAALAALSGVEPPPVPRAEDDHGAPVWPEGVVGSITHCDGYRAAAVARRADILALGIDAEPHGALPEGVLDLVHSTVAERAGLETLTRKEPAIHWDRLLFSAKESIYKAWFPYHHRVLEFKDAEVRFVRDQRSSDRGFFSARLFVPGPLLARGIGPDMFTGRWMVRNGLVVTAVATPAEPGTLLPGGQCPPGSRR
ncbi:4'-phosphopantetheinyl transferase superfamily protein [Streptomyces globisporus]|uniref:4'-phosphopantetheinyl transferase superfamily protein n=1 Tax=Streptomyces globisporus TaxID=1908 RepID=A0A423V4W6_STRGL|nr:4'-phosphopantetheinyl transferase superfamily protein [Streptomyces globisporus]ROV69653.1 4'-phosphopantetheinyl transferase superfamily protein [Streptomyces globisporus]